jgi:hypothetical protein
LLSSSPSREMDRRQRTTRRHLPNLVVTSPCTPLRRPDICVVPASRAVAVTATVMNHLGSYPAC